MNEHETKQGGCEHDWRVDPHEMLMSYPPQERLVCANCGALSSRFPPGWQDPPSQSVQDWGRQSDR